MLNVYIIPDSYLSAFQTVGSNHPYQSLIDSQLCCCFVTGSFWFFIESLVCLPNRLFASYFLELNLFYFRNKLRLAISVEDIVGERIRGNKSSVLDLGKVEEVVAAVGEGDVAVAVEDDQEEGEEKTDNWDWEEEYLQIFWFPFLY